MNFMEAVTSMGIEEALTALIVAIILFVIFTIKRSRELVVAAVEKYAFKLRKNEVKISEHPIFNEMSIHIRHHIKTLSMKNKFFEVIIRDREEVKWKCYKALCLKIKELSRLKRSGEFSVKVTEELMKTLEEKRRQQRALGIPSIALDKFEDIENRYSSMMVLAIKSILKSPVYDSNKERAWAIFEFIYEYMEMSKYSTIEVFGSVNGELKDLEYKGHKNEVKH